MGGVKNLYQSPVFKAPLSEYAASSSKEDISRNLKKEAEDDLFDLVSRKTSMSRRTSVVGSSLPTRVPSISAGYIPQPLQRLIEKIDNPPKDGDCGYTYVACRSGQGRGISTPELIRKHLSAELKIDKKMYEMIEGRNIDKDIRNT
ncbi:hypothetical protein BY996DRAFT_8396625 [Phakopsora pachyrhizi]|nr:hypothetical protein BY996DRAFT_8396625 [Phakopsora pachyrhizi]